MRTRADIVYYGQPTDRFYDKDVARRATNAVQCGFLR